MLPGSRVRRPLGQDRARLEAITARVKWIARIEFLQASHQLMVLVRARTAAEVKH